MTTKWLTPPELITRGDRGFKLTLHAKKRADGKSQDYRTVVEGTRTVILWRFTVRAPQGCKTFWAESRAEAERLAEVAVAKLATQDKGEAKPATERTVLDAAQRLVEVKAASNSKTRHGTVSGYKRDIERFIQPDALGKLPVVAVMPDHVEAWIARHAGPKAGSLRTRDKRIGMLRMVFRFAVTRGWCDTNPVLEEFDVPVLKQGETNGKTTGDQRIAKVLSEGQLAEVIGKLDPDDPALRLLVEVTGRCGFRLREVTHLRVADVVDHESGALLLRVASGFSCDCRDCRANGHLRLTKSGKTRLVPVPPDLADAVRKHSEATEARFGSQAWLFPCWRAKARQRSRPGQLRVPHVLSGAFAAAAEATGFRGFIFHDLRSTAKTHLLMTPANRTAVDIMFGHALPGMDATYIQLQEHPALLHKQVYPAWEPKLVVVKKAKTA
jgi:integrase